jgi:hypothetical protein
LLFHVQFAAEQLPELTLLMSTPAWFSAAETKAAENSSARMAAAT